MNLPLLKTTCIDAFHAVRKAFIHLCFPPCCLFCHDLMDDPDHLLCPSCNSLLELIHPATRCATCFSELNHIIPHKRMLCLRCRLEKPLFQRVGAAFDYMGPAAALVKRLKYGNAPYLAKPLAAFLAMQYVHLGWRQPDYIIPVPMPTLRQWMRGYNQSACIAKELSNLLKVPLLHALGRKNGELRQAQLSMEERHALTPSHFFLKIDPHLIEDKRLLIIDDVWTTGSTMRCCAETLAIAYPASLYALTVCHTARETDLLSKKSKTFN